MTKIFGLKREYTTREGCRVLELNTICTRTLETTTHIVLSVPEIKVDKR